MKILCKNKYWNIVENYNINKILYFLIDRPNYINYFNDFVWKNNKGEIHRDYDLPSIIFYSNGHVFWYKNNKKYRQNNKPTINSYF